MKSRHQLLHDEFRESADRARTEAGSPSGGPLVTNAVGGVCMSKTKPKDQDTFRAIVDAIDSMEVEPDRLLSIQLDKSVRDAICAAKHSGQAASVSVTVKVRPGADRRMSFSASVQAKLPRPPVSAVALYADEEGHVHRSDPAQGRLPFTATIAKPPEEN